MLQEERYETILALLKEKKHIKIEDVQKRLAVSLSTIRRDFRALVERKLARRSHGGLSLFTSDRNDGNLPFELRKVTHAEEKDRIAIAAASLIEPHQTLYIDGGTTTLQLVKHLPKIPMTVVTNSLPHVMLLVESHRDNPDLEIYSAGGYVYATWNVNLGPQARYCLSQYHAHYAFLSCRGIDKHGVYNHNELIVEIERTMIENSDRTVLLMDHSKVGARSMSFLCAIEEVDTLITRNNPSQKTFFKTLKDKGVNVIQLD
ncbi:DeoR family transcriptional regulator [bacterium]|nr:DeoR family transcriptional regulator [bacterium]